MDFWLHLPQSSSQGHLLPLRRFSIQITPSITGFVNLTTQDELIGRVHARYAAIPVAQRHAAKASLLGCR
jgi:hypothetical protein